MRPPPQLAPSFGCPGRGPLALPAHRVSGLRMEGNLKGGGSLMNRARLGKDGRRIGGTDLPGHTSSDGQFVNWTRIRRDWLQQDQRSRSRPAFRDIRLRLLASPVCCAFLASVVRQGLYRAQALRAFGSPHERCRPPARSGRPSQLPRSVHRARRTRRQIGDYVLAENDELTIDGNERDHLPGLARAGRGTPERTDRPDARLAACGKAGSRGQ